MSLKLIPTETGNHGEANGKDISRRNGKQFNPGNKIKKNSSLKVMCLKLVHFINRGSRFTYEQIDELIMGMQSSILGLQKKKQEILKNKITKFDRKKIR